MIYLAHAGVVQRQLPKVFNRFSFHVIFSFLVIDLDQIMDNYNAEESADPFAASLDKQLEDYKAGTD